MSQVDFWGRLEKHIITRYKLISSDGNLLEGSIKSTKTPYVAATPILPTSSSARFRLRSGFDFFVAADLLTDGEDSVADDAEGNDQD